MADTDDPTTELKRRAAEAAVDEVASGMAVGLGTGSTAIFATRRIAALLAEGVLHDVVGYATSKQVWAEAERLGISMLAPDLPRDLDLTIDGADEVDPDLDVIKGGGGALLREKIAAQASRRAVLVVDESKLSPRLGTNHALPVEVLAFGWRSQARFVERLGARPVLRLAGGEAFLTDSGNYVLDCEFGPIADPERLAAVLGARAGIVEHGLFLGVAAEVVVAGPGGVRRLSR